MSAFIVFAGAALQRSQIAAVYYAPDGCGYYTEVVLVNGAKILLQRRINNEARSHEAFLSALARSHEGLLSELAAHT